MNGQTDRYVVAETNGGWGAVAFVWVLTIVLIMTVTLIHKRTYKHPTDVTWHARGERHAEPGGR